MDNNKASLSLERTSAGIGWFYLREIERLRSSGSTADKAKADELQQNLVIASEVSQLLTPVLKEQGTSTRVMTIEDAIKFVNDLAGTKIGGTSLRPGNASSLVRKTLRDANIEITEELTSMQLAYMKESLDLLEIPNRVDEAGRLVIASGTESAIETARLQHLNSTSEAGVLLYAIRRGMEINVVREDSKSAIPGLEYKDIKYGEGINNIWDKWTDAVHAFAYGQGKEASKENWRDNVAADLAKGQYIDS